jgi:energy-coupling factor transporter ATP-binding protein EcfA2
MPNSTAIKFSNLRINGWRQFGEVNIELHPQLTVITGANGSGKSTILNIFSGHFGYERSYLSTPCRDSFGTYSYLTGIVDFFRSLLPSKPAPTRPANAMLVCEITYTDNSRAMAYVPKDGQIQYQLTINDKRPIQGFLVPSHRRLPNYQPVGQIPTHPMLPAQAYANFNSEMMAAFQGSHSHFSSIYRIKEALLSMAVFGPGNTLVQPNPILVNAFEGFSETLRKILPVEIGFIGISIRSPDVVLITKSGDFLIDAASGGLMALVDLTWQIYMFSLGVDSFVVTIDEPENHLHPSMQRTLMSNLIKTFPQVQFIVATHSPFIVSALRDARVYVLKYKDHPNVASSPDGAQQTRFVSSIRLDSINRAGTASEILRDVLGLPTTYPEWVEKGMQDIIVQYRGRPFNEELLASLRKQLLENGYGDFYPQIVSEIVKQ